jgi:hypothetical protein
MPMSATRRNLTLADLSRLADVSATAADPMALFVEVDRLVGAVIGHKLFTMMRVHEATAEVERIYSSNTVAYPVGGRKQKRGTPWSRVVLDRGEAFADHELIASLGIGAIMNVPLAWRGRRLGTMNISHEAGWFTDADAHAGRLIAAFVVPSLLTE